MEGAVPSSIPRFPRGPVCGGFAERLQASLGGTTARSTGRDPPPQEALDPEGDDAARPAAWSQGLLAPWA